MSNPQDESIAKATTWFKNATKEELTALAVETFNRLVAGGHDPEEMLEALGLTSEQVVGGAGYTDKLNALLPPDMDSEEFDRLIATVSMKEFEDILREVAPGNPFAENLLAAATKPKKIG